ncbi:MAG: ISLre2 family transposase [Anaerolineaceae bacterium]|nr:ISLre2 family transposase [Anaerolineaceae bacterium]
MTEITVPISITIKVCGQKIEYEEKIKAEELEKGISRITQKIGGQVLKAGIDGLDEEIRNRIPNTWQNVGTEERSVISSVGWINYQRRIYKDDQGKLRKLVDEILGLEAYSRVSRVVEQMGAYLASESNYREAADRLSWMLKTEISHSAIQRMAWKIGNQMADMEDAEREQLFAHGGEKKSGKIKTPILYGESDGVWVHLQREKRRSTEVRVGIMYSGKAPIGKKRNKLENKCSVVAFDMGSEAWQEELLKKAHQKFDLTSVQLLIAGGDGNSWVKDSFARFEIRQEYVLDRFHIYRAARGALGNWRISRKIVRRLRQNGFEAVKDKLLDLIQSSEGKRKEKLKKFYVYLRNNCAGLQDLKYRGYSQNPGSLGAIEGNVDKLVVRRMKGRGRSWRRPGLRAMLALCQKKQVLRAMAFDYQPIVQPVKLKRKRYNLSVQYNEWTRGSMPVFSGPHQSKPWVKSLYRVAHGS